MSAEPLPTPQQCPQADVVIYDGACPLCRGTSRWLGRLDGQCRLAFLSLEERQTAQRFADLSRQELCQSVYVVEPNGRRHRGAEAVRYLVRRLPALWPLAPIFYFPGSLPLWRALYRWISHHRYGLRGKSACR